MTSIKQTIDIDVEITAHELAEAFCAMDAGEQAQFFAQVWSIAKGWPGAGWCQQSCSIIGESDADTRAAIVTLATHLPAGDIAYIVAAAADGEQS